ncbi:DUF3306 domain-containing protein [Rhodobacteraceae bacterium D3-12]|nr:DUF3306 domain-containing protein [Rhodobacteraceae bacterium D3-12]
MSVWSKRKAAVAAEEAALQRAEEVAQKAEAEAALAEKTDEELLAEFDLPVPEEMGEGDDFRAFLSDAVPERLKTRALRQLWRVNPVLANVDGLVDYGEDFTDAAMCVENLQSAYQVGKGMLAHVEEMARQAEAEGEAAAELEPEADAGEEQSAEPDEPVVETVVEPVVETVRKPEGRPVASLVEQPEAESVLVQSEPVEAEDIAPTPGLRRMAFTFDEQRTG